MIERIDLLLRISGVDLGDIDLADLGRNLREELLVLGVEEARPPVAGSPPEGAKAGEALAFGALLVSMAPALAGAVIDVATSWLSRQPDTVELNIAGQQFKGRVTREQRDALVAGLLHQISGRPESP
jgi:hypothetical protein